MKVPGFRRLRSIAALGSANVVGLVISLVALPIVSRLYDPAEYGTSAIVAMLGALIGPLANLAYQDAIILVPTRAAALNVAALCAGLSTTVAAVSAAILLSFARPIATWLHFSGPPSALALASVSILLAGANAPLSYLANRSQRYRILAVGRVASALSTTLLSITFAALHFGAIGLVMAALAGHLTTLAVLTLGQRDTLAELPSTVSWVAIRALAREHSNFPRYTLPTNVINAFTDNLPRTLIASMFGEAVLGLFSRAAALLALPLQVVAGPVSEIFRRDLSAQVHRGDDVMPLFRRTAGILAALGAAGLLILVPAAPVLLPAVLGERWRGAAVYAQLLGPMFALRLVNGPLSFIVFVVKAHRFDLQMTIFLLVASLGTMAATFYVTEDRFTVIGAYSALCSLTSAYMTYRNFAFARTLPGKQP